MTVNERLFASGLLEEFDDAVARRDVPGLGRILRSIHLSAENIQAIITQLADSSPHA